MASNSPIEQFERFMKTSDGVMWFGSSDGLLRRENGQWQQLTKKDGLATDDARVIVNRRAGGLWIGGYGGLSSLRKGKVEAWTVKNGLPGATISGFVRGCGGSSLDRDL